MKQRNISKITESVLLMYCYYQINTCHFFSFLIESSGTEKRTGPDIFFSPAVFILLCLYFFFLTLLTVSLSASTRLLSHKTRLRGALPARATSRPRGRRGRKYESRCDVCNESLDMDETVSLCVRPLWQMLREILQPDSHPRKQAGFVVEAETAAPSAPVASLAYNDCLFRK
ncbi:hypothetical protein Q7C36_013932 [Tachysurus vachellii]|uniref:Uncharacterized protein n=1 Tax=Tachysurus vachellii TaxID=175792 RepID=A0AA88SQ23_TACVA|nr:hypothetical protein Q7C36_013932 [Tachysurus vachellii]